MKLRHVGGLLAIILMAATVALADGVNDPVARTGGGGGGGIPIQPNSGSSVIVVTSTTFPTFNTNNLGGGVFTFLNESGVTFNTVSFVATIPASNTLTFQCGGLNGFVNVFPDCTFFVTLNDNGTDTVKVVFDTTTPGETCNTAGGGVPNGCEFTLSLNNANNAKPGQKGGWLGVNGKPNTFGGTGSPSVVPEPATLALTLSGLSAMLAARKRSQKQ